MADLPARLRIPAEVVAEIACHLREWDVVRLVYIMPASLNKPLESSLKMFYVLEWKSDFHSNRLNKAAQHLLWGLVRPKQPLEINIDDWRWRVTRESYDMKLPPDLDFLGIADESSF